MLNGRNKQTESNMPVTVKQAEKIFSDESIIVSRLGQKIEAC